VVNPVADLPLPARAVVAAAAQDPLAHPAPVVVRMLPAEAVRAVREVRAAELPVRPGGRATAVRTLRVVVLKAAAASRVARPADNPADHRDKVRAQAARPVVAVVLRNRH
jgi:hypothetical protein